MKPDHLNGIPLSALGVIALEAFHNAAKKAGTDKGCHTPERLAPLDISNRMEEGK